MALQDKPEIPKESPFFQSKWPHWRDFRRFGRPKKEPSIVHKEPGVPLGLVIKRLWFPILLIPLTIFIAVTYSQRPWNIFSIPIFETSPTPTPTQRFLKEETPITACGGWNTSGEVICECSGKLIKETCPPNSICDSRSYFCEGSCSECCYKGIAQGSIYPKCKDDSVDKPEAPETQATDGCVIGGCSGEICAEEELFSTCIFRPESICYGSASCERQLDGSCGWTQTPELTECLGEYQQDG